MAGHHATLSKLTSPRIIRLGAILIVTLAAFALALYARWISEYPPLSLADLTHFEFDSYALGIAIQELAVPIVLVYIFSTTPLFRRVISGETMARDTLKLFGVLLVIQLLSLNYLFALSFLTDEQITFGTLIVVVGRLLGGWRMGLGLGLVTMFVYGIHELIFYPEDDLLFLYQTDLRKFFDLRLWGNLLVQRYLMDPGVSSLGWAGIIACLGVDLLGERRFTPLAALGLEVGIDLGVGYLTAISWEAPTVLAYFLIPSAVVSGLAIAAIALMMRSVQVEAARRKAEAAELALTRAELRALRAQINPHFLFNALNTIRYFVRTDADAARRLLLDLSEVFQRALRSGEFIPLRDELSYVEAYLALEKARLDKRLQVVWSIQTGVETYHYTPPVVNESPLLDCPVPTLVLQPIVENAVIHGVAKKRGGGTVSITVKQMGDDLLLQVEDDGPGVESARLAEVLNPELESSASIGLRNVDGRLRTLYGDEYRLAVTSEVGRGTCVQIKIPVDSHRED
jgi:LytS/YehU family sensor histidine kinase